MVAVAVMVLAPKVTGLKVPFVALLDQVIVGTKPIGAPS